MKNFAKKLLVTLTFIFLLNQAYSQNFLEKRTIA